MNDRVGGWLRFRLSAMMFLHYFALGAWIPALTTYLLWPPDQGGLRLDASRVGMIYSTLAVAGMVVPLLVGLLADRLFATEKLLGVLNLAGGGLLLAAGAACERAGPAGIDAAFPWVYGLMLAYSGCVVLAGTLTTSISLRNLAHPERHFGGIRLYGTVGWIASGLTVGFALDPVSPEPVYLAGAAGVLLGALAFLLPHTPPAGGGRSVGDALGLPALGLLRVRSFAVFVAVALLITATQSFYTLYGNPFLTDIRAPWPTALQTVAQLAEVGCMLLLAVGIGRFGIRGMMLIGLAGWVVRFALLATGNVWAISLAALPLHGLSYTFFYVVAALYVDRLAPRHLRSATQGIITFVTLGLGMLAGNWVAGRVLPYVTSADGVAWREVWLLSCAGSAVATLVFAVGFWPERESRPAEVAPALPG